jgi:hypothetical protein
MVNIRKLQMVVDLIRREGPTNENLRQAVITLADQMAELQRELDRVQAVAQRADRNTRVGIRR